MFSRPTLPLLIVITSLLSMHCGVTMPVRVLDEGTTQIAASLGGPFIPLGSTTIPVPYLNIGLAQGCSENVTLCGNIHLLPMLLGDAGLDAGIATQLLKQRRFCPELTGKAAVLFFSDFRNGMHPRIYPQISVNASYLAWRGLLIYAGADNVYQAAAPQFLFTPFAGVQLPFGPKWTGQLETKWIAANVNTAHGIYEGQTNISNHGNTSIYVALIYSL
jgi:hypothetical protein